MHAVVNKGTFAREIGRELGSEPGSGLQKLTLNTQPRSQPSIKHAGNVIIQAATMLPATPQRTAERRLVAPTPIMDELMQWVVLTGMPILEAASITTAAAL